MENVRKGLQNRIKERAEESDKATAIRRERFVGSTFSTLIFKCELLIAKDTNDVSIHVCLTFLTIENGH